VTSRSPLPQEFGGAATRRIVPGGDPRENLRHGIELIWQIVEAGPDAKLALYELTTYCLIAKRWPGSWRR
jgi:hypothetical protein